MVTAAVIVVIERDYRCLFIFADMFGNAAVAVVVAAAAGFRMVKGFSFTHKGTIVMIVIVIVIVIISWGAGSARRFSTSKRID